MKDCVNYYWSNDCGVRKKWVYGVMMGLLGLVIVAMTVILERKILRGLQLRTGPMVVGW